MNVNEGSRLSVTEHDIWDAYVTEEGTQRVLAGMRRASELNKSHKEQGQTMTPDNNPGLDHILSVAPEIAWWIDSAKVSSSLSLDPFYMPNPGMASSIFAPAPPSREWLENMPHCVALRNRAKIELELYKSIYGATKRPAGRQALIVAAGRGRYPLLAAALAKKEGVNVHLDMVDIDKVALHHIKGLALDAGFEDYSVIDRDILDLDGYERQYFFKRWLRRLAGDEWPLNTPKRLKPASYDVVSGIGLSMYIPEDTFQYSLGKRVMGRDSVAKAGVKDFYGSMWRYVKPGGRMIVDAINPGRGDNHVELQLEMIEIIGWRRMFPRSEEDVLKIAEAAGIRAEKIEIHTEPVGFFSVFVFQKAEDAKEAEMREDLPA